MPHQAQKFTAILTQQKRNAPVDISLGRWGKGEEKRKRERESGMGKGKEILNTQKGNMFCQKGNKSIFDR